MAVFQNQLICLPTYNNSARERHHVIGFEKPIPEIFRREITRICLPWKCKWKCTQLLSVLNRDCFMRRQGTGRAGSQAGPHACSTVTDHDSFSRSLNFCLPTYNNYASERHRLIRLRNFLNSESSTPIRKNEGEGGEAGDVEDGKRGERGSVCVCVSAVCAFACVSAVCACVCFRSVCVRLCFRRACV